MKPHNCKQGSAMQTETKLPAFADRPDKERFFVRDLVGLYGGALRAYCGPGFSVEMPNKEGHALQHALELLGWKAIDDYFFPLGSDKPPAHQRHHCFRYQTLNDDPGYWRIVTFYPKGEWNAAHEPGKRS